MLVLLPPSAGKTTPEHGPRLDLNSLAGADHNGVREDIISSLQQVSASADALKILKVGASIEPEVRAQIDFYDQPCAPAYQVYTGVLYEAANFAGLDQHSLARADACVRIFSAVFGYTRPGDLIPNYRLSMGTTLPELGNVGNLWKKELHGADLNMDALSPPHLKSAAHRDTMSDPAGVADWKGTSGQAGTPEGAGTLVVDCRSAEYQVWSPPAGADYVVVAAARIKDGRRTVVSHAAKYYRGLLTGALVREPNPPRDVGELFEFAHVLIDSGDVSHIELDPAEGRKPTRLTLVEDFG